MWRLSFASLLLGMVTSPALASEKIPPIDERFAAESATETPDFQRHVVPLLGRLGCNGRACHGSFQGQGGFALSLFGYDFEADLRNLAEGDNPRVDVAEPAESLILQKPTLAVAHKGGNRLNAGSWQYRVLEKWIATGAAGRKADAPKLTKLEITPREIDFAQSGEQVRLQVEAVWSDGTREVVTPLCRFQTNDEQVATIDETGIVASGAPGDTHVVVFYDNAVEPIPVLRPISERAGEKYPPTQAPTRIDELVVAKLRRLGIVPSDLCTDAEFLRRASVDITGTLPTAREVEAFLADVSPDKRSRKIDELLERPAYAAWWATWLCDLTGNNPAKLNNVGINAAAITKEWFDWLHRRVAENQPYDELVAGIVLAVSRESGETFDKYCEAMSALNQKGSDESFADRETLPHYWARRNFRTPNERALGFAYTFLGVRIQCAECHKHPFDQWTQHDFKEFAGFFGRLNYGPNPASRKQYTAKIDELGLAGQKGGEARKALAKLVASGTTVPFQEVFVVKAGKPGKAPKGEKDKARPEPVSEARLLGGETIPVARLADPRTALMDWLRRADNPYFAKAFVNRVWARYFHAGLVSPTDDLSRANPPSNAPLLDYLAEEFVRHDYDIKWLHREIANSRTYQLSWHPNETNRLDERNFSHAIPRRLPAEVAYDAVRYATASEAELKKLQTDVSQRAIAGAGSPIKGKRGNGNYALQIFGKSLRENNCDCDRSDDPSVLQTIYLLNDNDTLAMIDGSRWIAEVLRPSPAPKPETVPESPSQADQELKQQILCLERRLERSRAAGKSDRVQKIERRLIALRKQAKRQNQLAESPPEESSKETSLISREQLEPVIREAYLRILGRPPESAEQQRAEQFIEQASQPTIGLRGLVWALLNTKEFIVNH